MSRARPKAETGVSHLRTTIEISNTAKASPKLASTPRYDGADGGGRRGEEEGYQRRGWSQPPFSGKRRTSRCTGGFMPQGCTVGDQKEEHTPEWTFRRMKEDRHKSTEKREPGYSGESDTRGNAKPQGFGAGTARPAGTGGAHSGTRRTRQWGPKSGGTQLQEAQGRGNP